MAPLFAWMGLFACPSREMVLFFTVAVAYGLGCWSIACVLQNAYRYVLTNKRVRAEFRFLRTWSRDAPLRAVTDVSTHQDAAGRSLNFGTVAISTAGTSFPGVIFKGVADPHEVESLIIKNISRMRSRR